MFQPQVRVTEAQKDEYLRRQIEEKQLARAKQQRQEKQQAEEQNKVVQE